MLRSPPPGFPGPLPPRSASREPRALRGSPRPEIPGRAAGRPLPDQPGPEVGQLGPGRGARSLPKSSRTPPGEGAAGRAGRSPADWGRDAWGLGRTYLGGRRRRRAGRPRAAAAAGAATARGSAGGRRLPPADPWQPDHSRGPALAAGAKVPRAPPSPHLGQLEPPAAAAPQGAGRRRRGAEGRAEERGGEAGRGKERERGRRAGGGERGGGRGRRAPQPAVTRRFLARQPPPPPAPLLTPSPPRFPARSEAETPRGGGGEAPRAGSGSLAAGHLRRAQRTRGAPPRRSKFPAERGLGAPGSYPSVSGRKRWLLSARPRVGGEA